MKRAKKIFDLPYSALDLQGTLRFLWFPSPPGPGRQRHALGWDSPSFSHRAHGRCSSALLSGSLSLPLLPPRRSLSDPGLHIIIIKSDQADRICARAGPDPRSLLGSLYQESATYLAPCKRFFFHMHFFFFIFSFLFRCSTPPIEESLPVVTRAGIMERYTRMVA